MFINGNAKERFVIIILVFCFLLFIGVSSAGTPLTPADVLKTKSCTNAVIDPGGEWIAYTVSAPRDVNDKAGRAYSELYAVSVESGEIKALVTGEVNVSSPQWSPDGNHLAFLTKNDPKSSTQIWTLSFPEGDTLQVSDSETNILDFAWHPSGDKMGYIATTPKTDREKKLKEKDYEFDYYEENLKPRNIYLLDLDNQSVEQLTTDKSAWDLQFSPDGKTLIASMSPKNLIDHRYMFRKIYLLNIEDKSLKQLSDNQGKLGNYAFSPDGSKLAYCSSLTREDHQVSQAYVLDVAGGGARNLTIPDFRGHVNWVGWQDNDHVLYHAGEGIWSTLSVINAAGGERKILLDSSKNGVIFRTLSMNSDLTRFAMLGSTPAIPWEIYTWQPGSEAKRLTTQNPWLDDRDLGAQKLISYKARDGVEIEGLLMYPLGYKSGTPYPLIVYVHGGPEHHHFNQWLTSYSTPGQVMAGKGYVVFYPNYRASTGYGVEFAMAGYGDPAGTEFDDIADGIDYLVREGIADKERVGLAGGSYGGYASAWFATYYTQYVKAVCMFVGISDLISKRGTTDITYEELYVHSGKKLEEMWDLSLKRSPIYYAHQSKTAVLIYGGEDDTRVHPSQSMELYYRLKMNDHPAVRWVRYPGERHGNAKQPGRNDVINRQIQWLDWYVYDNKPLDGPMPPLDISDTYGLDLD